jgi:protein-disulfide isomerase
VETGSSVRRAATLELESLNLSKAAHNGATLALVTCALLMTALVLKREFSLAERASTPVAHWKELLEGRHPTIGSPQARKQLILFSDYACPFCKDLDAKLLAVSSRSGADLAVTRIEFPLVSAHPRAYDAAVAAGCASLQHVDEAFQSKLFALQGLEDAQFKVLARDAGVPDLEAFTSCVLNRSTSAQVDVDMAIARKLGIDSVPAFIVDGKLYTGTREMEELERIVGGAS